MANQLCEGCSKQLSDTEQEAIDLLKLTTAYPKIVIEVLCDLCVIDKPRRK